MELKFFSECNFEEKESLEYFKAKDKDGNICKIKNPRFWARRTDSETNLITVIRPLPVIIELVKKKPEQRKGKYIYN